MMQIKCEMCGSSDLVKEDSFYVCKHCGMKYSPEEAKKMMVEIEGAVKIDDTEELANLHVLARRALDANSIDNALKYYDMILIKEPTNWEAAFYSLVFNATNCKVGELSFAFKQIENGIPQIVDLVKNNLTEEEKRCAYEEIANHLVWESSVANSSASKCSSELFVSIRKDVCLALYQFVGALRIAFPNKEFINAEMICLKEAIRMNSFYRNDESMKQLYDYYIEYIKQNSPETFQQVTKTLTESKKSTANGLILIIVIAALAIFLGPTIIGWLLNLIFGGIGSIFGI